jgi:predicted amidohydrolase
MAAAALLLLAGLWSSCADDPGATQPTAPDAQAPAPADSGSGPDSMGVPPVARVAPLVPVPILAPRVNNRVAAIQYGVGQFSRVDPSCSAEPLPDLCAVLAMFESARQAGAALAVGPEYSQGQLMPEQVPRVGDNPAAGSDGSGSPFIQAFSRQAAAMQMYIVANIFTFEGFPLDFDYYNSTIAFGPNGAVLAVFHKFSLWRGEASFYTPGSDVVVFPSPVGNVGMLICSDLIGSSAMHWELVTTLKARVVAFSTHWMTPDAVSTQANFAKAYKVYLLAANTTFPPGNGGGIYATNGEPLAQHLVAGEPKVVVADLPPFFPIEANR